MFRKKLFYLTAAAMLLLSLSAPALAAEVESGSVYCFSAEDFSRGAGELAGICVTELPQSGTVMLDSRAIRSGDILTAEQVARMTFCPLDTETDAQARIGYLPIFSDRVEAPAQMTISVLGRRNDPPVAEDLAIETYKNLPNRGNLKVNDPEGEALTFTVTRLPRRGAVQIDADGSFTYTPAKNKVGVDSFTFTAADPEGNVSREATVTVRILKPTDARQYQDTAGLDCRFEAEWLRSTGLFEGEEVGGQLCFEPERAVSRREFLTMVMELLEVSTEDQEVYQELEGQMPRWLQPYVVAALRSGLLSRTDVNWEEPITGAEAAAMVQNALDLQVLGVIEGFEDMAVAAMNQNGLPLDGQACLTRADAAKLLYKISKTN